MEAAATLRVALRFRFGSVAAATRTPKTDLLMIKDVADYLKVTERTIYRLAGAKQIPAFKVGGSWRFSKADINNWIQHQTVKVTRESCGFKNFDNIQTSLLPALQSSPKVAGNRSLRRVLLIS